MRREVRIPAGLEWWRGEPGGADWLATLPGLVAECAERWRLELGAVRARVDLIRRAGDAPGRDAGRAEDRLPGTGIRARGGRLAHWASDGAVCARWLAAA